jgi:hypothetical protein
MGTPPRFKAYQGPIGLVAMTSLAVAAVQTLDLPTMAGTTTFTDVTAAPSFWMGLTLMGKVALPVARAVWLARIATAAPFCPMSNAQHANGLDTWPNTVTCWPWQFVSTDT